jgi:hypothetical protein
MIKCGGLTEFQKGWIIGDFSPALFKTPNFEVGIHYHSKGTFGDKHIHKIATEFNIVVTGDVMLDNSIRIMNSSYWITEPNQQIDVCFLADTCLVVIKIPSIPGDKHYPITDEQLLDFRNWNPTEEQAKNYFKGILHAYNQ